MTPNTPSRRRARIDERLTIDDPEGPVSLLPGPVEVEEGAAATTLRDPTRPEPPLARVPCGQFGAWLATHRIVYTSWR